MVPESSGELFSEVHGIAVRPAIATGNDLATLSNGVGDHLAGLVNFFKVVRIR